MTPKPLFPRRFFFRLAPWTLALGFMASGPLWGAISNNLLAWYRFDETSGSAVTDSAGQFTGGALTATGTFDRGTNRNALKLAGSSANGVLAIPQDSRLNFTGPVAFSFWVKGLSNQQSNSTPTLLGKFHSSFPNTGFDLITSTNAGSGGAVRFAVRGTAGIDTGYNATINILNGNWHHIVALASNNGCGVWIDGTKVVWTSGTWTPAYNPVALMVGKRGSNDGTFSGLIDDFRIYTNVGASAADIAEMASLPPTLPTVALAPAPGSTNSPFYMTGAWVGDKAYSNSDAIYLSTNNGAVFTRVPGGQMASNYLAVQDNPWQVVAYGVAYDNTAFATTNTNITVSITVLTPAIPTLLNPSFTSTTNTNMSVNFLWATGIYGDPLVSYTFTALRNGQPWLNANTGMATNFWVDVAAAFGAVSTNTISWWVTAATGVSNYTSFTNTFVAALAQKVWVQGRVRDTRGNPLSGVIVQSPVLGGSYLLSDTTGRFDLGAQTVNQNLQVKLTPPGRYGVLALATNVPLAQSDVNLDLTLTNQATGDGTVIQAAARAPVFISGASGAMRLTVPLTWAESRRLEISAQALSGGRKTVIFEGFVSPDMKDVEVTGRALKQALRPGPHILEYRLTRPGADETQALVARQMFFYAQ